MGDSLLLLLGERSLACFDVAPLRLRWRPAFPAPWSSSRPTLWRGTVMAGTRQGDVHAFRLSDGARRWSGDVPGTIRGIGADGDVLYVGTYTGAVYALAPRLEGEP